MRRLLLLALVPLLALAGCGDDEAEPAADRPPVTEPDAETTTTTEAPPGDDVEVEVSFGEPLKLGEVTWVVTVVNAGDEPLELAFANGQRADVLLRAGGDVVYQWSLAQLFTQQLGRETVPAGGEVSFELADLLEVDPGEYELEAVVTATEDAGLRTSRMVTVQPR